MSLAVVLPGYGYGPNYPALYYVRLALRGRGWQVHDVAWADLPQDPEQWPAAVHRRAAEAFDARGPGLVVAKSLGSLAMPLAVERALPGVWLTPLLDQQTVRDAVRRLPSPSLLAGGTADVAWVGATARSAARTCGCDLLEIDGADHCFDVTGDAHASIAAVDRVVHAVDRLLDRLDSRPSSEE